MAADRQSRAAHGPPYLLIYGLALLTAEIVLLGADPAVGAALHGGILLAAGAHAAAGGAAGREAAVVALVPLTRLVSLVVPTATIDPGLAFVLQGIPLLVGVVLVGRAAYPEVLVSGLGRPAKVATQLRLAGLALPVGLLMLQTTGGGSVTPADSLLLWPISVVGIAIYEELLLRGLIQRAAMLRSPVLGILVPNTFSAILYLGSGSAATVAAMTAIGLIFSLCVARTGSLWGVIAAHALGRAIAGLA